MHHVDPLRVPLLSRIVPAVRTTRNRKRERRSWPVIRLGPEPALMSFDDRAAKRQADTHTSALRRVEGFEQPLKILRIDTATGILHAEAHTIVSFSVGSDQQLSGTVLDSNHRVGSIAEQV